MSQADVMQTNIVQLDRDARANCLRGDNWSWKAAKRQCGFWLASADSARRGVQGQRLKAGAAEAPHGRRGQEMLYEQCGKN